MNHHKDKETVRTMMLIGAPTAGKTSYISLALGYLQLLSCDKYALMPTREEDYEMTAAIPRKMREGIWPMKTISTGLWDVTVRHHYTVPALGPYGKDEDVEWNSTQIRKALINMLPRRGGEVVDRICFYDSAGEDFTQEISDEVLARCKGSDYFLLFVDAEKIKSDNQEVQNVLKRAAYLLQERIISKPDCKFYVAFIFTKCDTLLEHDDFKSADGTTWDSEKVKQMFTDRYMPDISRIPFHTNLVKKFFCVSCVPDHKKADPTKGVIATPEWSPRDMAGQIAPLRWISSHFY